MKSETTGHFKIRKMVRNKFKWKFALFLYSILLNVFTKSLPIDTRPSLITTETSFVSSDLGTSTIETTFNVNTLQNEIKTSEAITNETEARNATVPRNSMLREVRPGQEVRNYDIELTYDGNQFIGRIVIDVVLTLETREDPIVFHAVDLDITRVMTGVFTEANAIDADFDLDDGLLEISPPQLATSYVVIIYYSIQLSNGGPGVYFGEGNDV